MARRAHTFEKDSYQNLSMDTHDQEEYSGTYPHAYANVETRDDTVFFTKNTIDSELGNLSHGSYPFISWGINQKKEAQLTVDLGRPIETNWIRLLFRAGYPHDSYREEVILAFSDGEEQVVATTNTTCFQEIKFPMKTTQTLALKCLQKALNSSPFPALIQIKIFGRDK